MLTTRRRTYLFLGNPIGPKCWATILGVSPKRMQQAMHGVVDARYGCKAKDAPQAASVDAYCISLYFTVAGTMPHKSRPCMFASWV